MFSVTPFNTCLKCSYVCNIVDSFVLITYSVPSFHPKMKGDALQAFASWCSMRIVASENATFW